MRSLLAHPVAGRSSPARNQKDRKARWTLTEAGLVKHQQKHKQRRHQNQQFYLLKIRQVQPPAEGRLARRLEAYEPTLGFNGCIFARTSNRRSKIHPTGVEGRSNRRPKIHPTAAGTSKAAGVKQLEDEHEQLQHEYEKIVAITINFDKTLYAQLAITQEMRDERKEVLELIDKKVSQEDNARMINLPEEGEIGGIIRHMASEKAPGEDGLTIKIL
ncbi:hypothetical protein R1sor_009083 [Riccia sorocarpa]|uniref:Uncharacterized protein n=1 Tax=Riccia sorocarpa TaxID=122646 RepID=A0ABD3HAS9_9MARC